MNARILSLVTATIVTLGGLLHAGETVPVGTAFAGAWAGYDTEKNAGATGGSINLFIQSAESERFATVTGTIQVPNLGHQNPELAAALPTFREITGRVNLRTGAIMARCEKGVIRGHVERNGHGVVGRLRVNSGRYQIRGAYFADENNSKGQID